MPKYSDYNKPENEPPGDTAQLQGAWNGLRGDHVESRMAGIYMDLVTDDDWPSTEILGAIEPGKLWEWLEGAWQDFTGQENAYIERPDGAPCLAHLARFYYEDGTEDVGQHRLESLGLATGDPDPDDDGDEHYQPLADVKVHLHWQWCAYLTRCKLTMARATQFGYAPSKGPSNLFTDNDMAYDQLSSWYRVNRKVRENGELKSYVESSPGVMDAAQKMDDALSDFAQACKVEMPSGATVVEGNRFPVPKAWWTGKLAAWYNAYGLPGEPTLDTLEVAKRFHSAASLFRYTVGQAFAGYAAAHGGTLDPD